MKIDKIQINNFRAFYGENIFQIDGKNCLIYGENGSGKSSFYMALKMFIESSVKDTSKNFNYSIKDIINKYSEEKYYEDYEEENDEDNTILLKNIFSLASFSQEDINRLAIEYNKLLNDIKILSLEEEDYPLINEELQEDNDDSINEELEEELDLEDLTEKLKEIEKEFLDFINTIDSKERHFIEVSFDKGVYTVGDRNNNDVNGEKELINCANIKPFLNYKKLTRFYNSSKVKVKNDLFPVFKEILKNYITSSGKSLKDMNYNYDTLMDDILNDDFRNLTNNILNIFHSNLEIKEFDSNENSRTRKPRLYIKATYNEKEILDFHLFLNEARLSALSLSIYFASILKMYEIAGDKALKILVLDDILVGLDMGNRLNLIKVLEEYFSDFQIFMLTYDKAWYETVIENTNKSNWKSFEMYIEKDLENGIDKPYVIEGSNYFKKAEYYFLEKDYPACANYLRKEVERILKQVVDKGTRMEEYNYKKLSELLTEAKQNSSLSISKELKKMEQVVNHFKNTNRVNAHLYDNVLNNIKEKNQVITMELMDLNKTIENIQSITALILNPNSHDDTYRPLYKNEIEKSMKEIKKFGEIVEKLKAKLK